MKTYNIKEKIRQYFFMNPTAKLRVRQIERELKLPLPSVIRYCKELEKEGILKKTAVSGITVYSADRSLKRYLMEKKLFNFKLLFESGLVDYLVEEFHNPTIVVFGSYARGEDVESSDVDIYIETPSNKRINLEKYEKILNKNIQIFVHKNINEIKNKELANSILNGNVLNGYVEVFK